MIRKNLPVIIVSISLVISAGLLSNQADAANSSATQIAKLQAQVNIANLQIQALRGDFNSYSQCADLNFMSIQTHAQAPNSFLVVRPCG